MFLPLYAYQAPQDLTSTFIQGDKDTSIESKLFQKTFSEESLSVSSKHKRLEGVVDTFKLLAGPVLWLAQTIYRAVSSFFSWVGSLFSGAKDSLFTCLTNTLPQQESELPLIEKLRLTKPKAELGQSGVHDHQDNAVVMLRSCIYACDNMYSNDQGQLLKTTLESKKLQKLINSPSRTGTPAEIKKAFLKNIPKGDRKRFISEVHQARGKILPTKVSREFEINHGEKTLHFSEESKNIDTSIGANYLELVGGDFFQDEIAYINGHNTDGGAGVRLSRVRKEHHAQGMTTNARVHLIKNEQGVTIESTFRSGAFAVHDKYYPTESEYEKVKANDSKTIKKLAKRWGVDKEVVKRESRQRVKARRHLCIAQALPKVIASIKKMSAEGIPPEVGFLHVEQSLLSDKFPNDREMIKDMARAMETLRKHAVVKFGDGEESIEKENDKLIIHLTRPDGFLGDLGKEYPVQALFFSQGVNEMQSIGHAFGSGGVSLQDRINRRGLVHLQRYAKGVNIDNDPRLTRLAQHFSPYNDRRGKDLAGIKYIADAVKSLGGTRGFVCKSGKDRTGSEANDELAYHAARHAVRHTYDKSLHTKIRDNLAGGISWQITGQCSGGPNAYAFNEFQHPCLPSNWKPRLHLCRNGKS